MILEREDVSQIFLTFLTDFRGVNIIFSLFPVDISCMVDQEGSLYSIC